MIVALGERVRTKLDTLAEVEEEEALTVQRRALLPVLEDIARRVKELRDLYRLLHERLPLDPLVIEARPIASSLRRAQTVPDSDPYKKTALINVRDQCEAQLGIVRTAWKGYADGLLNDQFAVLDLVKGLLTETEAAEFRDLRTRLERFTLVVPSTDSLLNEFTNALEELRRRLEPIMQDLGPEVAVFLRRVGAGQANLADIHDDVLNWLRQHGWLDRFRVSFANAGR